MQFAHGTNVEIELTFESQFVAHRFQAGNDANRISRVIGKQFDAARSAETFAPDRLIERPGHDAMAMRVGRGRAGNPTNEAGLPVDGAIEGGERHPISPSPA